MEFIIKEGNIDAKVFISKDLIDKETMKQIKTIIHHKCVEHVRIMPDCHRGMGCCVGFTSRLTDKITPSYVGGDIGCGILMYPIGDVIYKKKLEKIEKIINELIPSGSSHTSVWKKGEEKATILHIETICKCSKEEAIEFTKKYNEKFNVDISCFIPDYSIEWLKNKCQQINSDYDYDIRNLGTLGGGNHYIEINESSDQIGYVTIHCGSRNFGHKVYEFHYGIITESNSFNWDKYDDEIIQIKRKIKDSKQLKSY